MADKARIAVLLACLIREEFYNSTADLLRGYFRAHSTGIGNSHRKGLRPGLVNPCSAPALPVQTLSRDTRPEGRLASKRTRRARRRE
jgi:hypothetical protein